MQFRSISVALMVLSTFFFSCDGDDPVDVRDASTADGSSSLCGNGTLDSGEACDDWNGSSGDGCSASCAVEAGFECQGEPSICHAICGDGVLAGDEVCDDGDSIDGDGCAANCEVEDGWSCTSNAGASVCTAVCGDGIAVGDESCDDGNTNDCGTCNAACDGVGTGPCANGTACAQGSDCESGYCDAESGTCAACTSDLQCGDDCTNVCIGGVCMSGPRDDGACEGGTGTCVDGACCTGCRTAEGTCAAGTEMAACGTGGASCVECTGGDICADGVCGVCAEDADCDDGNECTEDTCTDSSCVHEPRDGATCTATLPGVCVGDQCCTGCIDATGACQAGTSVSSCGVLGRLCMNCDDGDSCTIDICMGDECGHMRIPRPGC